MGRLTVTQANAVNTVANAVGVQPRYESMIDRGGPPYERAREALAILADDARRTLLCGVGREDVERAWPQVAEVLERAGVPQPGATVGRNVWLLPVDPTGRSCLGQPCDGLARILVVEDLRTSREEYELCSGHAQQLVDGVDGQVVLHDHRPADDVPLALVVIDADLDSPHLYVHEDQA